MRKVLGLVLFFLILVGTIGSGLLNSRQATYATELGQPGVTVLAQRPATPRGASPAVLASHSETPEPEKTPKPEKTPDPEKTPKPEETPEPAETPEPTETPDPTKTPEATETPEPEMTPGPPAPTAAPASPSPTAAPLPPAPAPETTPEPTATPGPFTQPAEPAPASPAPAPSAPVQAPEPPAPASPSPAPTPVAIVAPSEPTTTPEPSTPTVVPVPSAPASTPVVSGPEQTIAPLISTPNPVASSPEPPPGATEPGPPEAAPRSLPGPVSPLPEPGLTVVDPIPTAAPEGQAPVFAAPDVLSSQSEQPATPSRLAPGSGSVSLVRELPFAGDEPYSQAEATPDHGRRQAGTSSSVADLEVQPYASEPGRMPPALRVLIPGIGVDSKVVHLGVREDRGSWVWQTASHAVGHHDGTANPREGSNIVLSGHISSPVKGEGSVFKRLPEVRVGDLAYLETVYGMLPYIVDDVKLVAPTDLWVMYPASSETLTLITCYPDLVYSHRLVVTASPLPVVIF